MIRVTDTIVLDDRHLEERFVRPPSSLPADVKERLIALAGSRVTTDGVLLVDSREHRTQAQNRDAARARLISFVRQAVRKPRTRRPTRPRASAREKRLTSKKLRSAVKVSRADSRGRPDDD